MPTPSAQKAYNDLLGYVEDHGYSHRSWYCGITSDIEARLFGEHKVSKDGDLWVSTSCETANDAMVVQEALINEGFRGSVGTGDDQSNIVYVYRMTESTDP
jgi:hypothetical protein